MEYLTTSAEGYHSWSLDEIEAYGKAHPFGSLARLALALALYTGQRRSDLVRFGRKDVREDEEGVLWIGFTQHKGRNLHPITLEIPIIPELQRYLADDRVEEPTSLPSEYGKSFTAAGSGNRFRKWCDAAGLGHCSVHGLRKAASARLAELGYSEFEIMAMTDHQTSKEVTRYTKGRPRNCVPPALSRGSRNRAKLQRVSYLSQPVQAVGHFCPTTSEKT